MQPISLQVTRDASVNALESRIEEHTNPRVVAIFAPGSCGGVGPGLKDIEFASQFDASLRSIYIRVAEKAASFRVASIIHSYREPPIDDRNIKNPRSSLAMGVEDCMAAVRYMTSSQRYPGAKIVLFGFSYGGAVALGSAAKILEDRMLCAQMLAIVLIGSATGGLWWRERPEDRLEMVCPNSGGLNGILSQLAGRSVLVVHGIEDQTLPCRVAQDLYMRASEPKCLALVAGASHRLWEAKAAVTNFLIEWFHTVVTNRTSTNVCNLGTIRIKKTASRRKSRRRSSERKPIDAGFDNLDELGAFNGCDLNELQSALSSASNTCEALLSARSRSFSEPPSLVASEDQLCSEIGSSHSCHLPTLNDNSRNATEVRLPSAKCEEKARGNLVSERKPSRKPNGCRRPVGEHASRSASVERRPGTTNMLNDVECSSGGKQMVTGRRSQGRPPRP